MSEFLKEFKMQKFILTCEGAVVKKSPYLHSGSFPVLFFSTCMLRNLPFQFHAFCKFTFRRRFYGVHPPPPPPPPTEDGPLYILQWYFRKSFQTVPYTNRTRRVLYSREAETELCKIHFQRLQEKLAKIEEMLLSPTDLKKVLNNIINGLC